MERSITESYQKLPVQIKKIVRLHVNGSVSFNTIKAGLVRLLALFLSIVSLLMLCLTVFIGEILHVVSFFLVVPITIILLTYSNRIVVDHKSNCFLRVVRLLWCSLKPVELSDIKDTEVVMTKAGDKDALRVHLVGQVLHFDNPSDAYAFLAFLKQHFNANTLEQISDWPNKKPWMSPESNESPHSESLAPLSEHIVPVWSIQNRLKLMIPILIFSTIAGLVKLGNVL